MYKESQKGVFYMLYKRIVSWIAAAACALPLLVCGPVSSAAAPGAEARFVSGEALCTVPDRLPVEVQAKAYVLMNAETGLVLGAENEHARLYPASVTKIMTLLLTAEAIEAGKLRREQTLTCSESAANKGGSQIWLEPGEEMRVEDLLKASFVYSANDACTLLGEAIAGSESAFAEQMNRKAQELGMNDTHFDNCTGLDDDTASHLTSAFDVAVMSRALLSHAWIEEYASIWMDTLREGKTQLVNTNRLIRTYPGAVGLKTGTTSKAGCCVSAAARRDGMTLIAVVLGAPDSKARFASAARLLDHGFSLYELYRPETPAEALAGRVPVRFGEAPQALPFFSAPEGMVLDKGTGKTVEVSVEFLPEVEAPVKRGDTVGTVRYSAGGRLLAQCPITAAEDVARLTLPGAVRRLMRAAGAENGKN